MGYCHSNPARRLPLPKVSRNLPTVLSTEQVQQLLAAAQNPGHRLLLLLLRSTGLRRSEAAAITLEQVDLEHRQLRVRGKGNKERMVPLTSQVVEAIEQHLASREPTKCNHLFISRVTGEPLSGGGVYKVIRPLLKRAGLDGQGITPHKLRHTFATHLVVLPQQNRVGDAYRALAQAVGLMHILPGAALVNLTRPLRRRGQPVSKRRLGLPLRPSQRIERRVPACFAQQRLMLGCFPQEGRGAPTRAWRLDATPGRLVREQRLVPQ